MSLEIDLSWSPVCAVLIQSLKDDKVKSYNYIKNCFTNTQNVSETIIWLHDLLFRVMQDLKLQIC